MTISYYNIFLAAYICVSRFHLSDFPIKIRTFAQILRKIGKLYIWEI